MISRIWHGWTTPQNAGAYESLLKTEIFLNIQNRQIIGYRGIQLLRRNLDEEVEFITIVWFDSIEAVKQFGRQKDWTRIDVTAPESERWIRARQFYEKQGFVFTGPKLKFLLT
jgi:heme-degrading monooxygenase HmoA